MMEEDRKKDQFVPLLVANYVRIKSFIFTMLPNGTDADDVMQETCVTLWNKFDDFQLDTDFVRWAVTVAKYKVFEFRRKNSHNPVMLDTRVLEQLERENQNLFDKTEETTDALTQCIQKLSSKDRNFIQLRYANSLTLKKMAQRLGFSVTSVHRNSARIHGLLFGCIRRFLGMGTL